MVDNVRLDAGSGGDLIAADDDGTAKHQWVKVEYGANGTFTAVTTSAPLPVDLRADNVGGIEVVQDTAADLNVTEASAASIATLLGTIDADTGAIKTAVEILDNAISGSEMQVDVVAALPAGTNTIGGVIGQPSSTVVYDGTTACTVKEFMVVGTTAGNNTLVAAVAAKKIRLLHLEMIALSATANTVYIVNDDYSLVATSGNPIPIAADADGDNHGGFVTGPGWRRTTDTVNEAVVAVQSATAAILYMGTYIEVA